MSLGLSAGCAEWCFCGNAATMSLAVLRASFAFVTACCAFVKALLALFIATSSQCSFASAVFKAFAVSLYSFFALSNATCAQ